MKAGLRNALREIVLLGIPVAIVLFFMNHGYNLASVIIALLLGPVLAVPLWLIYRVIRFTFSSRAY